MITIMCPSRGRPEGFDRLVQSIEETTLGEWEIVLGLDQDDPERYRYIDYVARRMISHVTSQGSFYNPISVIVNRRGPMTHMVNRMSSVARGDIIVAGTDDFVMCTKGWDQVLRENLPKDGIYVAWFNDLFRGKCTAPIISKKWVEIVGQYCTQEYEHLYIDTWLYMIGVELDRIYYFKDVVFEHMHPRAGKAATDVLYEEKRVCEETDKEIFFGSGIEECKRIANMLEPYKEG